MHLMHLDYLVATHKRTYKDKEIIKVIGGQRSEGGSCFSPGVVAVLLSLNVLSILKFEAYATGKDLNVLC